MPGLQVCQLFNDVTCAEFLQSVCVADLDSDAAAALLPSLPMLCLHKLYTWSRLSGLGCC